MSNREHRLSNSATEARVLAMQISVDTTGGPTFDNQWSTYQLRSRVVCNVLVDNFPNQPAKSLGISGEFQCSTYKDCFC